MFDFIKKFFQKELPIIAEEVEFAKLNVWIDNNLSKNSFNKQIKEFFTNINEQKESLKEKLEILEKAKIDPKEKDKIQDRVKNIVTGHKDNYLREMNRFIEHLETGEEQGLQTAIRFNKSLNKTLDELAKRTAKNYQAAQHLFFKPVEEVFKTVGKINILTRNFGIEVENVGLNKISTIKEIISSIEEDREKKKTLQASLSPKEEELKELSKERESLVEEFNELRASDKFNTLKDLKDEENKLNDLIEDNENKIHSFFSKLGRALRKYEKVTLEIKLVRKYLENPITALLKDNELKIVEVLEKLGGSINDGSVELNDKQKDNALKTIETREVLGDLFSWGKELEGKRIVIEKGLNELNVKKEMDSIKQKIKSLDEDNSQIKKEILDIKEKLVVFEDNNFDELKSLIKDALRVELVLK